MYVLVEAKHFMRNAENHEFLMCLASVSFTGDMDCIMSSIQKADKAFEKGPLILHSYKLVLFVITALSKHLPGLH